MAQLLTIPIGDHGNAVLIVARAAQTIVMGFVAQDTLSHVLNHRLSACECRDFVERHLPLFEQILQHKSRKQAFVDSPLECIEIDARDLLTGGLGQIH